MDWAKTKEEITKTVQVSLLGLWLPFVILLLHAADGGKSPLEQFLDWAFDSAQDAGTLIASLVAIYAAGKWRDQANLDKVIKEIEGLEFALNDFYTHFGGIIQSFSFINNTIDPNLKEKLVKEHMKQYDELMKASIQCKRHIDVLLVLHPDGLVDICKTYMGITDLYNDIEAHREKTLQDYRYYSSFPPSPNPLSLNAIAKRLHDSHSIFSQLNDYLAKALK